MGRIVAFSGLKDGIGKTSLASHSAYLLSKLGYNVLLIDMDYLHHDLTKRIFGDKALLKHIEYREILYYTLENILSTDLAKEFPFSELPLSLKSPEKTEEGEFSIIPSYYQEPKPFWEKEFSPLWASLPKMLSYYKKIWDYIFLDTLAISEKSPYQIYQQSDMVVFLSSTYPHSHSELEDYIEYLSFSLKYPKTLFLSYENMEFDSKEGIPFSYDFFEFESKRSFHRIKFFWDFLQAKELFHPSSQKWTFSILFFLKEIFKNYQEKLPQKKVQAFLKNFSR